MTADSFAGQPLFAAELHYFRVPHNDWELLLIRLRQSGANTVSTYVPWAWHVPQRGVVDFGGAMDQRRDLGGFVSLCGALGLRVILKPGPFVDAELLGGGIPPWLLRDHPEIHALRPDGQPWRHSDSGLPRACYLHPTYLAAARGWIAAFSAVALAFQYPDGPVVAVQVDNEIPGDGMLPADSGLDARFKLDYNPYVVNTLWPAWLQEQGIDYELARSWNQPADSAGLRAYIALDEFTDWFYSTAVGTIAGWLREEGWRVPLYHDLLAMPWESGGTLVDLQGLAQATGWLGQNVYAEQVRDPFVGQGEYQLSFEEYVHYAHWRMRLTRHMSKGMPAFVTEISAAQDFYLAAPLVGGLQAINIYPLAQAAPDNPTLAAYSRWAMEAPVRPDGSVQARFWNIKTILLPAGVAGADFATAHMPANLALGYSHVPERVGIWRSNQADLAGCDHAVRSQRLAQRCIQAGLDFDILDLDAATAEELSRYALVLMPATPVLARATQAKLAGCANLAIVGAPATRYDQHLEECTLLAITGHQRLDADVDAEQIAELVERAGGHARYAWADQPDVDVSVRYGAEYTYLLIANRQAGSYTGTLAYRSPDGTVWHVHVGIGGLRVGLALLKGEELYGFGCGGDSSQGGWVARAIHTSMMFNGGAGVVVPCGDGLLLTAPHSGQFHVRRPAGWENLAIYRLLLDGRLLPAALRAETIHLHTAYVAEDELGVTDMYVALPDGVLVPAYVRAYLATQLCGRALILRRIVALCTDVPEEHHQVFHAAYTASGSAADLLEDLAQQEFTLDEYAASWKRASAVCQPAVIALAELLTMLRCAYAAGALETAVYAPMEQRLTDLLGLCHR